MVCETNSLSVLRFVLNHLEHLRICPRAGAFAGVKHEHAVRPVVTARATEDRQVGGPAHLEIGKDSIVTLPVGRVILVTGPGVQNGFHWDSSTINGNHLELEWVLEASMTRLNHVQVQPILAVNMPTRTGFFWRTKGFELSRAMLAPCLRKHPPSLELPARDSDSETGTA